MWPALQITTVPLEDTNDLTCLSLQEDHDVVGKICPPQRRVQPAKAHSFAAVGSQYWITLIDRRSGVVINQIRSVDQEWGMQAFYWHRWRLIISFNRSPLAKLPGPEDHIHRYILPIS